MQQWISVLTPELCRLVAVAYLIGLAIKQRLPQYPFLTRIALAHNLLRVMLVDKSLNGLDRCKYCPATKKRRQGASEPPHHMLKG